MNIQHLCIVQRFSLFSYGGIQNLGNALEGGRRLANVLRSVTEGEGGLTAN